MSGTFSNKYYPMTSAFSENSLSNVAIFLISKNSIKARLEQSVKLIVFILRKISHVLSKAFLSTLKSSNSEERRYYPNFSVWINPVFKSMTVTTSVNM